MERLESHAALELQVTDSSSRHIKTCLFLCIQHIHHDICGGKIPADPCLKTLHLASRKVQSPENLVLCCSPCILRSDKRLVLSENLSVSLHFYDILLKTVMQNSSPLVRFQKMFYKKNRNK